MLNVGIIGMGNKGIDWAEAVKAIEETTGRARLAGIVEISEERRKIAQDMFDCAAFGDYRAMLAQRKADIICIATPVQTHKELSVAALNAGLHVICEKPLAETVAEAEEIVATVNQSKGLFMVGFEMRFYPGFYNIRKRFASGELGKVCNFLYYKMKKVFQPGVRDTKSGFHEETVHAFDFVAWQLGRIDRVLCSVMERTISGPETDIHPIMPQITHFESDAAGRTGFYISLYEKPYWDESERKYLDTCWAVVKLANGAIGTLGKVVGLPYAGTSINYVVVTDRASVFIGGRSYKICWRRGWQKNPFENTVEEVTYSPEGEGEVDMTRVLLDHFADCIEGKAEMEGATAEDGLTTMKVLEACERSAREKGEVVISEI